MIDQQQQDRQTLVKRLALSIANCSEVKLAVTDSAHCCNKIVSAQEYLGKQYRQSPEPWAGDLLKSPILFIASNPSISESSLNGEDYPKTNYENSESTHPLWPDSRIIEFHTERFNQSRDVPFVNSNAQFFCVDGSYRGSDRSKAGKGSQTYWRNAFAETKFLLDREIDISADVCLTEIVHCKTKKETDKSGRSVGLDSAMKLCAEKYLEKILRLSGSVVIVLTGKVARDAAEMADTWFPTSEITWDIDWTKFGKFPRKGSRAEFHLGTCKVGQSTKIVCAMRHLSNGYGFGSFRGALGVATASKLAQLTRSILAKENEVPSSRNELLFALALKAEIQSS